MFLKTVKTARLVIAATAELEGIITEPSLPAPLMSLNPDNRKTLREVINQI